MEQNIVGRLDYKQKNRDANTKDKEMFAYIY